MTAVCGFVAISFIQGDGSNVQMTSFVVIRKAQGYRRIAFGPICRPWLIALVNNLDSRFCFVAIDKLPE